MKVAASPRIYMGRYPQVCGMTGFSFQVLFQTTCLIANEKDSSASLGMTTARSATKTPRRF